MTRKLRGGAVSVLPVPPTVAEFQRDWSVFYVTGHGSLPPSMMVVPPNTYILNLATAGRSCSKVTWEIENWVYDYKPDEAGTKTMIEKLYDAIKGGRFLRESEEGGMYVPGNHTRNAAEQYTTTKGDIPKPEQSLAFYEPGDIMFDNQLSLYNNAFPIVLAGVYQLPIPYELKKQVFLANKHLFTTEVTANTLNIDNLKKMNLTKVSPKAVETLHTLFNVPANLVRARMYPAPAPVTGAAATTPAPAAARMLLSEVVSTVGIGGAAGGTGQPVRLFIVNACRTAPSKADAKMARRLSIATRRRPRKPAAAAAAPAPAAPAPAAPAPAAPAAPAERSRLTLPFLIRIRDALGRTETAGTTQGRALTGAEITAIQEARADITSIEGGNPFSIYNIQDIFDTARNFMNLQPEFLALVL